MAVVSGIAFRGSILDLVDHIRHVVKKHPVMGDHDHRSVIVFQVLLQPLHRGHVQMVGRLVQKHDVRL